METFGLLCGACYNFVDYFQYSNFYESPGKNIVYVVFCVVWYRRSLDFFPLLILATYMNTEFLGVSSQKSKSSQDSDSQIFRIVEAFLHFGDIENYAFTNGTAIKIATP